MQKKANNEQLREMAEKIQRGKSNINDIKRNMAIESNELNVMGQNILKYENKIKELTQSGNSKKEDQDAGANDKTDGKKRQN